MGKKRILIALLSLILMAAGMPLQAGCACKRKTKKVHATEKQWSASVFALQQKAEAEARAAARRKAGLPQPKGVAAPK